jgi:hypothetical protein
LWTLRLFAILYIFCGSFRYGVIIWIGPRTWLFSAIHLYSAYFPFRTEKPKNTDNRTYVSLPITITNWFKYIRWKIKLSNYWQIQQEFSEFLNSDRANFNGQETHRNSRHSSRNPLRGWPRNFSRNAKFREIFIS